MMVDGKSKFKFYGSYLEQVEMLTDQEAGRLFKALLRHRNGDEVTGLSGAELVAYSFIKKQMDEDLETYRNICERNRINGRKGGRPKKNRAADSQATKKEEPKAPEVNAPNIPTTQAPVDPELPFELEVEKVISGELVGPNMKCEVTARFV